MKAIIFIGCQKSGSSREAIRAAEEMGYYTVLFTDRPIFIDKRPDFPDIHLVQLLDLGNIDKLKKAIKALMLKAIEICGIISFVDPHCHTAALLAQQFGVNNFSVAAIAKMQDKIASREALHNSPHQPKFITILPGSSPSKEVVEGMLPLVIKSPNSTGSKDVFWVNCWEEFTLFAQRLFKKYPDSPILVEEFLDGPQYLVETIVCQKQLYIIAVFEQEITYYNQRFIITGYNLLLEPAPDLYDSLKKAVASIIECHGMETGACHLEIRYVKGQWKLIEINPRISGGGMNDLIQVGLGINLVKETLKLALGKISNLGPAHRIPAFAQYVIVSRSGILKKVTGKKRALESPGVKSVYIKPRKGALLTPPISMGNRYAYVIATGDTQDGAKSNAKHGASQIQFWLSSADAQQEGDDKQSFNDIDFLALTLDEGK